MEKLPKKESGMQRIIGASPENQELILDYFKSLFEKDKKSELDKELDPEVKEMLLILNQKMKEFLSEFGTQALEVKPNVIHVLDQSVVSQQQLEDLRKKFGHLGSFLPGRQQIAMLIDYQRDKLKFVQTLVHEMFHANSFQSAEILKDGDTSRESMRLVIEDEPGKEDEHISLAPRRRGFAIDSSKVHNYFDGFDEAIITELSVRFEEKYFKELSFLSDDLKLKESGLQELAKTRRDPVIDKKRTATITEEKRSDGSRTLVLVPYGYWNQREKLDGLIQDLFEKNKTEFYSSEEVFDLFARATLTGRLLPLARLIEKTYSKGSFRQLGKETKDKKI